ATFQFVCRHAEHADITAQGQEAEFPPRAMTVVETEQLAPEADREHLDPDPAPAGDQEMAHLVNENQGCQENQEPEAVARNFGEDIHASSLFLQYISFDRGCGADQAALRRRVV